MSGWDVSVLVLLLVVGGLYLAGSIRLMRRGAIRPRVEPMAFTAGWAALVATVLPPIDTVSSQLFSIHMVQHELLMVLGSPLMTAGRPLPVLLGGMPVPLRRRVAAMLQSNAGRGAWGWLTTPVVACTLHGLALWIWHLPALYQLAVRNEGIHVVQHAMFVGTAVLFWWGILYGRYGRAGYGVAAFFVFITVVHSGILGAAVTFATTPLYPDYIAPTLAHGRDPVEDQQLAGLIMWVPAGFVLTVLGIGLFAAWLGEAARRERQAGSAS